MTEQRPLDPDALKMFSFGVFSKLEGAVTAGMIHLGDRLGLYAVMASSVDGDTSESLASKAGLHERWVREWLHNQVAARIVSCEDLSSSHPIFHLSPEGVAVLATPDHPAYGMGMFHRLPQTMGALEAMPEAFRTGVGHDYDSHGPEGAVGIERSFEPWNQNFLIPMVIPALDGLQEKLSSGIRVADIGCGSGGAALLLGATFPKSVIDGFDISKFDCIHDMTRPTEMMRTIRKALKDDGTWLLVDIKAHDSLELNVSKNPMASLLYGISVLSCMSSAMSETGGEGLGTLGLSASRAESMARDAGFTQFKKLDVEHSVNAFYEVRP